jgi:AraC family transcriptional regulator
MIYTVPSPSFQARGTATERPSYILHERESRFQGAGVGALSIKSFYGGRATYTVGRARLTLDERAYLVLNPGQAYQVEIEASEPVESFCVFFAHGFAEQVYRDLATPDDRLLADPAAPTQPVLFFEQIYPHDQVLSPALFALRRAVAGGAAHPPDLTELMHGLMTRLLEVERGVRRTIAAMPAARPATREELYRRVQIAKQHADSSLHTAVTLDELAAVAGMSPNHLLRTFRRAFGLTPHQYIVERRLERAKALLAGTSLPVTEICTEVGFESLGTFSWLFRRRVGFSPSEYRSQSR